jgi:hypothetical protein
MLAEAAMGILLAYAKYVVDGWVGVTVILAILLVYRNVLSVRENDELYLNKAERRMMGSEQRKIIRTATRLTPVIMSFVFLSGALLFINYVVWAWNAYHGM